MAILEATFPGMTGREETARLSARDAGHLDAAALAALVDLHAGTLYRVAYSVVRHAEDAEDVVQETYMRVLRHAGKLQEIRDARVWLIRIAWNLSLDRKRRRKTFTLEDDATLFMQQLPSHDLPADKALAAAQGHARLLRMMDSLPAKERQVLLLSAMQELSTVEIAEVLKTTESTVRSRLFRARQRMRERLEADKAADNAKGGGRNE
jgi:RNA polymerase sigma-70 factor (ECF subfamily)